MEKQIHQRYFSFILTGAANHYYDSLNQVIPILERKAFYRR